MNMILSADQNWGIGCNNKLLVSIPSDMKFFRQETTGKVVVMGRKTLESFPGGMPLKNRINIVLTKDAGYDAKGAVTVHSKEELLEELKKYNDEDVYVIGGGEVYHMMLAYQADTFFPNLDQMPEWEITASSEEQTYFDLEYTFLKYERKK